MKKLLAVLFTLTAVTALTGCDDTSPIEEPPYVNDPNSLTWGFTGPVKVVQPDGSTYTHADVITQIVFDRSREVCDMFVYDVSFAGNMPIQIDMEVYGLAVEATEGGYKITGNDIKPRMGTREFEAYTIYGFEATVTTSALTYKMTCGDGKEYNAYPVTYNSKGFDPNDIEKTPGQGGTGSGIGGGTFVGLMAVDGQSDGSVYTQQDTWFGITFDDEEKSTATLVMYNVKFSEKMGIVLDEMIVEGIKCVLTPYGYRLTGDGIVPVWNNVGVEKYTVHNLTGLLTSKTITLSMDCGDYPLKYSGNAGEKPVDSVYDNDPNSLTWDFRGPVNVTQTNGSVYTHDNVITRIVFDDKRESCDMFIYKVSFSSYMPIEIDMEVYGLKVKAIEGQYILTGDGIVPKTGTNEFEAYTVYEFRGIITTSSLEYTMTCGDGGQYTAYPVSYEAKAYEVKELL